MVWRVIVSTIGIMLTTILLGYVTLTESDRMAQFSTAYNARQIENGATLYANQCARCHGTEGQGGVGPALNAADLFTGQRLNEIGWIGGLEPFLRGTITSGRPRASAAFANAAQRMPAWGESYGGPLRRDQIESLVVFIMNWGKQYEGQAAAVATEVPDAVGTDIAVVLPAGDAARGKQLTVDKGCTACHMSGTGTNIGPAWDAKEAKDGKGIADHATERFKDETYTGKATSAEQYVLESIIDPNAFLVSGEATYSANGVSTMPADFGKKLSKQDTADIVAYLITLK